MSNTKRMYVIRLTEKEVAAVAEALTAAGNKALSNKVQKQASKGLKG